MGWDPRDWDAGDWVRAGADVMTFGGNEIAGNPVGKTYDKATDVAFNRSGNAAAHAGIAQAQAQNAQLQKQQMAQRQADLNRALGYFAPVDAFMQKMYPGWAGAPGSPGAMPGLFSRPGQDGTVPAGSQNYFRDGPDLNALGGSAPTAPTAAGMFARPSAAMRPNAGLRKALL